jgi:hypothetical protein
MKEVKFTNTNIHRKMTIGHQIEMKVYAMLVPTDDSVFAFFWRLVFPRLPNIREQTTYLTVG